MHEEKEITASDLIGIYGEIAELTDIACAVKIYEHFKGQQVSFPTRLYTKDYILTQINADDKQPIKKMATQYGYSERRLRQIIKESNSIKAT